MRSKSYLLHLFFLSLLSYATLQCQTPKALRAELHSLNQQTTDLEKAERYEESLPIHKRIHLLCESPKICGEQEKLQYLLLFAECQAQNSLFSEAIELAEDGLRRQILETGAGSFPCAAWYNVIGVCNRYNYKLSDAGNAYQKAYDIIEAFPDSSSKVICEVYSNYGTLQTFLFDAEKAEFLYTKCFDCFEKMLGNESKDYSYTALLYASFLMKIGDVEKSEKIMAIALPYFYAHETDFGVGGEYYYYRLDDLHFLKKNYEKALFYTQKAQDYCKQVYEPGNAHIVKAQSLLCVRFLQMGRTEGLEDSLKLNIAHYKLNYAEKKRDYATMTAHLGRLYTQQGKFQQAQNALFEADSIYKTIYKPSEVKYYFVQSALSQLYEQQQDYPKAIEALNLYSTNHWAVFDSLSDEVSSHYNKLGKLQCLSGDFDTGVPNLYRAGIIRKKKIASEAHFLSELELSYRTADYAIWSDLHLALLELNGGKSVLLRQLCYEDAIYQKGFLMANVQNTRKKIDAYPEAKKIQKRLFNLKNIIASELSSAKPSKSRIATLQEESQGLEKQLARLVKPSTDTEALTSMQEVAQKLGNTAASVEFVHFRSLQNNRLSEQKTYAALVLQTNSIDYIPLFDEKELSSKLDAQSLSQKGFLSQLYQQGGGKYQLFDEIWKPIFQKIKGANRIYFAPSGTLYTLALPILSDKMGKAAGEYADLVLLGSSRSLVHQSHLDIFSKKDAVLVGGVDYGNEQVGISDASPSATRFAKQPLNWTQAEVDSVQNVLLSNGFTSSVQNGKEATEAMVKTIGQGHAPRILHFATHGYFFPNPKSQNKTSQNQDINSDFLIEIEENPMIRSGLLLAGVNETQLNTEDLKATGEDGVLTAYEISQLDLSQTEIVLLSACETALGDVQGNEGVYGLQRAFKIAGAKNIVMTLWNVPDWHTKELMIHFYHNWITEGLALRDALLKAQLFMRDQGHEPYIWAGFILLE